MPAIEDVVTRLKNAKLFTVLHAKNHFCLYHWKQMPFTSNQCLKSEFSTNLKGVEVIVNDSLVYCF